MSLGYVEAAGWVAADRGAAPGSVTLRPRDATFTFRLEDGREEVLSYSELIAEGERLRSQAIAQAHPPRSRPSVFRFDFDSPLPGGRR